MSNKVNKVIIGAAALFLVMLLALGAYWWWQNRQAELASIPPLAPVELRAEEVSADQVILVWNDVSNNELAFKLFRNGELVRELPKNTSTVTDYGLKPSTVYEYKVVASNDAGEAASGVIVIKTKNPLIRLQLDKIGVVDNGEPFLREVFDKRGEIYLGVVIKDGDKIISRRLPADGYYRLVDNGVQDLGILLFYTPDVGDYLSINIIGFEHDGIGSGGLAEELLVRALDMAIKGSMGTLSSLILDAAGVDFTSEIRAIGGFSDDFMGEYYQVWEQSDNWGIGSHQDIQCDKDDGSIGLRIWFTISGPSEQ